jgi:hypothetical protein
MVDLDGLAAYYGSEFVGDPDVVALIKEVRRLREATRWRRLCDEKPEPGQPCIMLQLPLAEVPGQVPTVVFWENGMWGTDDGQCWGFSPDDRWMPMPKYQEP